MNNFLIPRILWLLRKQTDVLRQPDECYTSLIHNILTEYQDILGMHFPVQLNSSAQTSMKYLIKYIHLNVLNLRLAWATQRNIILHEKRKIMEIKLSKVLDKIRKSLVLLKRIYICIC